MKIKSNTQASTSPSKRKSWIRRMSRRTKLFVLSVFLILFAAMGIIGNKLAKTKGFTGLWDFISTVSSNYYGSFSAEPEKVSITIQQEHYDILKQRRDQALQRGVIINEEGSYVPAEIKYNDKTIKVKLRLKGHMTDHIQGDKWSFRVNVKGKDSFMGMRLFSLQHPGTRGYVYEWIYHQMMKREEIIALRYNFVQVELNGKDLGIYAVEENFDEELIESNQRKRGPVMRFNPDLYWVDRYNELLGNKPVAEFASFQSADLEAYRTNKVISDSLLRSQYLRALGLMEGFRRGKLKTSEVFDISRLATFHAMIDLVGGHHSLDWSDIKYYYNPVTDRLEPVAYESFTVFPSHQLSGTYRYIDMDEDAFRGDYHKALFSDEVFFREYIKALERISAPAYLDSFFAAVDDELQEKLAILYKEFPYKKFDKQQYYRNQQAIRKMLDTPKGFHAYYESFSEGMINLKLGAIESLPVEITGLSIDTQQIAKVSPIILPSKPATAYVKYKDASFKMLPGINWSDSLLDRLNVDYRVLGSSQKKQVKVFAFPYVRRDSLSDQLPHRSSDLSSFPFIEKNDSSKVIYLKPGNWTLDRELILPAGYIVQAKHPFHLDIRKGGRLLSWSPVIFKGTEEQKIKITSSDSLGQGIAVISAKERSVLEHVEFIGIGQIKVPNWSLTGALSFYESPVTFEDCIFSSMKAEDALSIVRSEFSLKRTLFQDMLNDGLDADFSNGSVIRCAFELCLENGIDISSGSVSITDVSITDTKGKALNLKAGAIVKARNIRIFNSGIAVAAEDLSEVSIQQLEATNCTYGLVAFKNKSRSGPARISAAGLRLEKVKTPYLVEKNSFIEVDGKEIKDKTGNVDKVLKDTEY